MRWRVASASSRSRSCAWSWRWISCRTAFFVLQPEAVATLRELGRIDAPWWADTPPAPEGLDPRLHRVRLALGKLLEREHVEDASTRMDNVWRGLSREDQALLHRALDRPGRRGPVAHRRVPPSAPWCPWWPPPYPASGESLKEPRSPPPWRAPSRVRGRHGSTSPQPDQGIHPRPCPQPSGPSPQAEGTRGTRRSGDGSPTAAPAPRRRRPRGPPRPAPGDPPGRRSRSSGPDPR